MQFTRFRACYFYVSNILKVGFKNYNFNRRLLQPLRKYNTGIVLFSLSWFSTRQKILSPDEEDFKKRQNLLVTADALFQDNKHREICLLLNPYKDGSDVELLWRLVRAQYNLAQDHVLPAEEKKSLILEGYDIINRALSLDEGHFANHKWMSIMLDARSHYFGIKERITQLDNVKKHMQKAIELNPRDATTLYMLGLWCFEISNMPWYQRKIASTIFATPPVSSFEEALGFFLRAEEMDPRFYSMNLLMLGKTYLQLNNPERARYYLELASKYTQITEDDHRANKEATELLKKISK